MTFLVFTWCAATLGVVGIVLNIRRRRECFLVWMVTNVAWAGVDFHRAIHAQALLHVVYFGLSVWGWFTWAKHHNTTHETKPSQHDSSTVAKLSDAATGVDADGLEAAGGESRVSD